MAGRTVTQTEATINANKNVVTVINELMTKHKVTQYKLADEIGLDRKTIMAILNYKRSPKLDVLVRIYDYFGLKSINIPFDSLCSCELKEAKR